MCELIKINVLLSSDDNYAPLTGVVIQSLLKNNENDFDSFSIFILDGGIEKINQNKIKEICDSFKNTEVFFVQYDHIEDIVGIDMTTSISFTSYARLFAASLLPEDIDKILYLDADAIVNDSFKTLYESNIDDYYVGAVEDMGPKYINQFLGLSSEVPHYNAGFLFINLKKWREDNLEQEFIDCIIDHDGRVYHNDQGIINLVCKDKILRLPPEYNILSPFIEVGYDNLLKFYGVSDYYTKEIVENAIKNPIFIHLTQFVNGRPWFNNAKNHPLRDLFDYYVNQTPFKKEVYTNDTRGFYGKFLSLSYKIFPYSFVCWMFGVYRTLLIKKNFG